MTLITPPPLQDDPNLENYNVDKKVEDFVKTIATQRSFYRHNHVMLTMGEDFQWESAREWYKNLDKLMKYTAEKVGINSGKFSLRVLFLLRRA